VAKEEKAVVGIKVDAENIGALHDANGHASLFQEEDRFP
jgi:hypothetical protein